MKNLILILIVLSFISCTPTRYYIKPVNEFNSTLKGNPASTQTNDNLNLKVSNAYYTDNSIYFNVLIENNSERTYHIQPSVFFYIKKNNENHIESASLNGNYRAANPENELNAIENAFQENEDNYKIGKIISWGGLAVSLLTTAFVADNNEERVAGAAISGAEFVGNYSENERNYDEMKNYLIQEKNFWQNEALPSVDLKPNEHTTGLIVFYFDNKKPSRFYHLYFPIENIEFNSLFEAIPIEN